MAEQKNQNEHLNVEDALTQSEAFLIKYKNAIIGGVVAVIIIVAGFIMYPYLFLHNRDLSLPRPAAWGCNCKSSSLRYAPYFIA